MITRKYIGDYRLDDSLDERGKLRTRAVYVGGDYGFSAPERADKRHKWAVSWLCVACWLFFIGALLPNSLAAHCMYCILPFAACGLTLALETSCAVLLLRVKEPFRREQADRLNGRLPASALWTAFLSAAALLGLGLRTLLAREPLLWGDAVFAACGALLLAASVTVRRLARCFQTRKLGS